MIENFKDLATNLKETFDDVKIHLEAAEKTMIHFGFPNADCGLLVKENPRFLQFAIHDLKSAME